MKCFYLDRCLSLLHLLCMVTPIPDPLRNKLGNPAADALAEYVQSSLSEHKTQVLDLTEERISRRIAESENRIRKDMADGFQIMETKLEKRFDKIDERFDKIDERFAKMDERFATIDEKFDKFHDKFEGIHHQFTLQTRWMIGLAIFMVTTFKLLDLIFQ